ncbi:MAG TPA: hypothetical protein VHA78_00625 [Candidatus Peribacteraceae bacterium]|nr:hypothetical protein [Candidatus Peribacteraceae bacterium]
MSSEAKTPAEWCEYALRLADESDESIPTDLKLERILHITAAMHGLLMHMIIPHIEDAEHIIPQTSVDQNDTIFSYKGAIGEFSHYYQSTPEQKINYHRLLLRYMTRIFEKAPISLACRENAELQEIIDTPIEINLP